MKKIVLLSILTLLLCGCSNSNVSNLDIEGASSALDAEYTNMASMDATELQVIYGLDVSLAEEYKIKSSVLVNGNFYAILKVSDEREQEVKQAMDNMFDILESQSNLYSPEAVNMIKNRLETTVGDYLIYLVSEDNNKLYEIITGYIN